MDKILSTTDLTVLGLELFCKEARANGVEDDAPVTVQPEVRPSTKDTWAIRPGRPASLAVSLPIGTVIQRIQRVVRGKKTQP